MYSQIISSKLFKEARKCVYIYISILFRSLTTLVITLKVNKWMPHLGACIGGQQLTRGKPTMCDMPWEAQGRIIEFPWQPQKGSEGAESPPVHPEKAWYQNQEEAEWGDPGARGHGEAWPSTVRPVRENDDQMRTTKPPLSRASCPWQWLSAQTPPHWKERWKVEKGGKPWTDGV